MIVYNYTSLKKRETKIYNIGGYNIAGGIGTDFLIVLGPCVLVAIVLGCIISIPFGISFFNIFSDNFKLGYTLFWLILGISVGLLLWYVQFGGYKLYQYLGAYFRPKKVYQCNWRKTERKMHNYKFKTFIKHIF